MSGSVASDWKGEVRAQLRLAVPVVAIQLGMMSMGAIDGAFMGRVSPEHFAAVTLGHTWTFTWIAIAMGILTGLDPVASQAFGAGDAPAIRRALQRGLVLALVLTVPVALAILPAEPVFEALGQPREVLPIATDYSLITIAGVPAFLLFVTLRQVLQAMHRLRALFIVIVGSNLLNVVLDWMWIGGHLGFPAGGAVGSAWATVVGRWSMAFGILWVAWGELAGFVRPLAPGTLRLAPILRLLRLGLPVGISFGIEIGAFGVVALLMGRLGAVEMAGHQVAMTLASISFMFPLGISIAASVRVGNAVGRGDQDGVRRASTVSLAGGALVMVGFALLFLVAPHGLARVFTDLPDVLAIAVTLMPLAALFQVFDGVQIVAVGVLRGTADTRWPMVIHFVGFWFVGVPLALVLGFVQDGGPRGLWWGIVGGLAAVAVVQFLRVRWRLAGPIARFEADDEHANEDASVA